MISIIKESLNTGCWANHYYINDLVNFDEYQSMLYSFVCSFGYDIELIEINNDGLVNVYYIRGNNND